MLPTLADPHQRSRTSGCTAGYWVLRGWPIARPSAKVRHPCAFASSFCCSRRTMPVPKLMGASWLAAVSLSATPTIRSNQPKVRWICKGLFHNLCQTNTIVTRQNYGYSILGSKFLCRCSCWQHVIARRWSTRPVDRVRAASQAACAGIRNPDHPPSNSSFRGDLPVCSITRVQFGGASVTSIPTATVVPSTAKRHIATLAAAASSLHAVTKAANL